MRSVHDTVNSGLTSVWTCTPHPTTPPPRHSPQHNPETLRAGMAPFSPNRRGLPSVPGAAPPDYSSQARSLFPAEPPGAWTPSPTVTPCPGTGTPQHHGIGSTPTQQFQPAAVSPPNLPPPSDIRHDEAGPHAGLHSGRTDRGDRTDRADRTGRTDRGDGTGRGDKTDKTGRQLEGNRRTESSATPGKARGEGCCPGTTMLRIKPRLASPSSLLA